MHADHRAPCGPGLERRGAQAAGGLPCHGLARQAQGLRPGANSRSAKKAAAVSPAPPLPGGSPPPALTLGLHAYFQPAPAREGLPELVSPAPSGGHRESQAPPRGFKGQPQSREGASMTPRPWAGPGGQGPRTRVCRGAPPAVPCCRSSMEGPLNKQDERCFPVAHHSDDALAITGPLWHCCGLLQADSERQQHAFL